MFSPDQIPKMDPTTTYMQDTADAGLTTATQEKKTEIPTNNAEAIKTTCQESPLNKSNISDDTVADISLVKNLSKSEIEADLRIRTSNGCHDDIKIRKRGNSLSCRSVISDMSAEVGHTSSAFESEQPSCSISSLSSACEADFDTLSQKSSSSKASTHGQSPSKLHLHVSIDNIDVNVSFFSQGKKLTRKEKAKSKKQQHISKAMTLNTTAQSVNSSPNISHFTNSDRSANASSQFIGNKRKRQQNDLVNYSADDSSSSLNTTHSSDNLAVSAPDSQDFVIASDDAKAIPINRSKQRVAPDKHWSSSSLTSQGAAIARWLNAECLSSSKGHLSKSHGHDALRFNCKNGHNFFLRLQDVSKLHELFAKHCPSAAQGQACSDTCMHVLSQDQMQSITWCTKCSNFYNKAKQAASRIDLKVTGGLYGDHIQICCNKANHKFNISYHKKLRFLSCLECSRDERQEQKQRQHDEDIRHNELCRQMQEKLFAQANMRMQNETRSTNHNLDSSNCTCGKCNRCYRSNSSPYYWNQSSNQSQVKEVSSAEYYASLEQAINLRASYQAKAYLQDTQATQLTYEQCYLVYKFVQTPTDALVSGMKTLASRSVEIDLTPANTYYRQLARQLHPDKNCHPMAKDAFQRVTDSFEMFKKQVQFDQIQGNYANLTSSFAHRPDARFNSML